MAETTDLWTCPQHGEWLNPPPVLRQNGDFFLACPVCGRPVYLVWGEETEEEEPGGHGSD
jgi:hypothetical protein